MRGPRVYPAFSVAVAAAMALAGCGGRRTGRRCRRPPSRERSSSLGRARPRRAVHVPRRATRPRRGRVAHDRLGDERIADRIPTRGGLRRPGPARHPDEAELRRLTGNLSHAPPALKPDRVVLPPPRSARVRPGARACRVGGVAGGPVVRVLFGPFSPVERFRSEAQDVFCHGSLDPPAFEGALDSRPHPRSKESR